MFHCQYENYTQYIFLRVFGLGSVALSVLQTSTEEGRYVHVSYLEHTEMQHGFRCTTSLNKIELQRSSNLIFSTTIERWIHEMLCRTALVIQLEIYSEKFYSINLKVERQNI